MGETSGDAGAGGGAEAEAGAEANAGAEAGASREVRKVGWMNWENAKTGDVITSTTENGRHIERKLRKERKQSVNKKGVNSKQIDTGKQRVNNK